MYNMSQYVLFHVRAFVLCLYIRSCHQFVSYIVPNIKDVPYPKKNRKPRIGMKNEEGRCRVDKEDKSNDLILRFMSNLASSWSTGTSSQNSGLSTLHAIATASSTGTWL